MAWTALLRVFKPGTPGLARRVGAIPRMIAATMRGEYDGKSRLAMMAVAGMYIVSPIDLVPEAIFLLLGLIDDAAVAVWFAGAILDETERFLEWERQRATVIPGHTVPGAHPGAHPGPWPGAHPGAHSATHPGTGHPHGGHRRPA
jgi:uncharacterized membrane protein YkvA (DUF1232 family)